MQPQRAADSRRFTRGGAQRPQKQAIGDGNCWFASRLPMVDKQVLMTRLGQNQ